MNDEKNYNYVLELHQNIQILEKYLKEYEQRLIDLENIINAINDFFKTKKDTEILVPLVNGIFFKANITDNSHFLVNIGSNGIVVNMSLQETKDILLKQIELTKQDKESIKSELDFFVEQLNRFN